MKKMRTLKSKAVHSALLLAGLSMLTPTEAEAADWIIEDDSSEARPWELGILVGVPYCCGDVNLSPGALLGIPLVDKGFVPINDSFYLEVGAWTHIGLDPSYFGLTPVGGVRWNFHLMEVWDAYGALRVGPRLRFDGEDLGLHVHGVAGTTWKFSESVGLRGEFGGGALGGDARVGVDIDF